MTRAVRLILCFLLVVVSQPRVGEAPLRKVSLLRSGAVAAVEPESSVAPPSVRITHEIVHVKVSSPPTVRPRPLREDRQARTVPRHHPQKVESGARRLLFGDGTYRPEPFPRPSKD